AFARPRRMTIARPSAATRTRSKAPLPMSVADRFRRPPPRWRLPPAPLPPATCFAWSATCRRPARPPAVRSPFPTILPDDDRPAHADPMHDPDGRRQPLPVALLRDAAGPARPRGRRRGRWRLGAGRAEDAAGRLRPARSAAARHGWPGG